MENTTGGGGESPHCHLLEVDGFNFLLDCGWDETFDMVFINNLKKVRMMALLMMIKVIMATKIKIMTIVRAATGIGNTYFLSVTDFFAQKGGKSNIFRYFSRYFYR